MPMQRDELIGRGFAWPLGVDGSGSIALIGGTAMLDQSILAIVGTPKGERVMRPQFGCAIWDLVFAPITTNNLGLMEHAVRDAIGQWEPRVTVDEVSAVEVRDGSGPSRQGEVRISVSYTVRTTNDRRNLVFPFYVIPGEGEGR